MASSSKKSLVLVVGAGASKEVGLPLGAELKKQISATLTLEYGSFRLTKGDAVVEKALHRLAGSQDVNLYLEACRRISAAMPQAISIDHFINSHRSEERIADCGKLAIARCILLAESRSWLYVNPSNVYNTIQFNKVDSTWFHHFFQILTENVEQSDLHSKLSKVGIICFNYDRCIEHYLHGAFRNYYGMSGEEATDALSHLDIHHPYGTVGKLPWRDADAGLAYGAQPSAEQLLRLAQGLRTFTEGVDPRVSDITAIRAMLNAAERLAFLGFAFHSLNIKLLFPGLSGGASTRQCPTFATAVGISGPDVNEILLELAFLGGIDVNGIHIESELPCSDLFHEFRRGLSLG